MGLYTASLHYCLMRRSPARRENTDLSITLLIIIGPSLEPQPLNRFGHAALWSLFAGTMTCADRRIGDRWRRVLILG
jgi:hypothetical protein